MCVSLCLLYIYIQIMHGYSIYIIIVHKCTESVQLNTENTDPGPRIDFKKTHFSIKIQIFTEGDQFVKLGVAINY